jgi:formylglycine-generating enzyme required for sulfatase activity
LAFAGTLRQNGVPIATPQTVSFSFKKNGASACSVDLPVTPDADGQFTVAIPLATCPASLFSGKEVKVDIGVSGSPTVTDQTITSVPTALYAQQVGYPDCPLDYERDAAVTSIVLCRQGVDEVVRVGTKSSAFWIDRYESSVWEFADGTGLSYGTSGVSDYPFPVNGQLGADNTKGYAISKAGVLPSTYISWFQADVACHASGKRLPTSAEWGIAARGTPDPGVSLGDGGKCRTGGLTVRLTGAGTQCASVWGAQDMIGNVAEVVSDWYAAPSMSTTDPRNGESAVNPWETLSDDATTNLSSIAGGAHWTYGIPAALLRGGGAWEGTGAGTFNLNLSLGPQANHSTTGFRCLVPR